MGANNGKNTHWQKDSESPTCSTCRIPFSVSTRRHHCRNCGFIFCDNCSNYRYPIPKRGVHVPVRVCAKCFDTLRKSLGRVAASGDAMQFDGSTSPNFCENDATGYEAHNSWMGMDDTATNKSIFWGESNGPEGGKDNSSPETAVYYDPYARSTEDAALTYSMSGRGTDNSEKERLVDIWLGVRQRAVFIDIMHQQVERVEEDTDVMYCREVENIRLQPEGPELLGDMFPFPQATENNMELLLETFDPHLTLPHIENQKVDSALKQLSTQLLGGTIFV